MIGAIIGDIVGSRFEFVEDMNRGKSFALFASGCRFTVWIPSEPSIIRGVV